MLQAPARLLPLVGDWFCFTMKAHTMYASVSERFWSKVIILGDDECWIWTRHKIHGYGRFQLNGKPVVSHRLAFELTNGPIPDGLVVRHTCDNPSCCNPSHLLLGTHADNVRDMMERNRNQRGERSRLAKLKEGDIVAIRNKYKNSDRERSLRAIAKEYGVQPTTIRDIVIRKTWRHVT